MEIEKILKEIGRLINNWISVCHLYISQNLTQNEKPTNNYNSFDQFFPSHCARNRNS